MSDDIHSTFTPHDDGTFTVHRVQDVEPILEHNKNLQSQPQSRKSGLRHIASIPLIFIEKWGQEMGVNLMALPAKELQKVIRRKLADPDYRWLRTDK